MICRLHFVLAILLEIYLRQQPSWVRQGLALGSVINLISLLMAQTYHLHGPGVVYQKYRNHIKEEKDETEATENGNTLIFHQNPCCN